MSVAYQLVRESGYSASHVCSLLGVSRATYYRNKEKAAVSRDEDLRASIEKVILRSSGYGSRRITLVLVKEGFDVGRRRVRRIMREYSLLCQLKRRWTRTTDSVHGHRRFENLAKRETPVRQNQIWVSDITYLRMNRGFCYLAVVLDAYTRKVVGWHLSRSIDAELTVTALRKALKARNPPVGWIHHSDQGVQYACRGYVEMVESNHGRLSMSSKACPYDNAKAESFFATIKKEHVYQNDQGTFEEIQTGITEYIDQYYNPVRLHSALSYKSPESFESSILS